MGRVAACDTWRKPPNVCMKSWTNMGADTLDGNSDRSGLADRAPTLMGADLCWDLRLCIQETSHAVNHVSGHKPFLLLENYLVNGLTRVVTLQGLPSAVVPWLHKKVGHVVPCTTQLLQMISSGLGSCWVNFCGKGMYPTCSFGSLEEMGVHICHDTMSTLPTITMDPTFFIRTYVCFDCVDVATGTVFEHFHALC